jgi:hypothetical protein
LANDTWRAENILPGEGITVVHFVLVDPQGKKQFDEMAQRKQWGAFGALPSGSIILHSVGIRRV